MRAERRAFPHVLRRIARTRHLRRRLHSDDVEAVAHALERLVREEVTHGLARIFEERAHLFGAVTLGHVSNADAARGVGGRLQGDVRRHVAVADGAYQNVIGHHHVGERRHHLAAVVAQVNGDVDRILRHRHQEDILKALRRGLGLGVRQPLLKQRREGIAVDDLPRAVVAHRNLTVTLHRHLTQPLPFAIPPRLSQQLVNGNMLLFDVTRKDIVDAQRLVYEPAVEVLRRQGEADAKQGQYQHQMLLIHVFTLL